MALLAAGGAEPFAYVVQAWIELAIMIFALVIEVVAFGHCLVQRPDAFVAIGTLSKGIWLAITGGAILVTLLLSPVGLLGLIGITAAAIYLLDVRPALRDVGDNSW